MNMGIKKDLKKYIKDLKDISFESLFTEDVVENLEEILSEDKERKNKRKKKVERNEYIAVKQSDFKDDGDTFEAIKDGYGIPPMGCKFVKVRK
jgi:type I site-specific restriction-modification system R (restriction) subunit